jgi:TonB-linked SusC/RagA family outer membrane protein
MRASPTVRRACATSMLLLFHVGRVGAQDGGTHLASASQQAASPSRLVTLELRDVPLREALKAVAAQAGISLIYASSTVPLERRVSLRVNGSSVQEALRALLQGTDVEVRSSESGKMMLVRRPARRERSDELPPLLSILSGRVTDAATGAPVARVTVSVDRGSRRTATDDVGQYMLADVPVGTHAVHARRIGYAPGERTVVVPDSGVTTVDFALSPVASRLDEVVTTVTGAQRRLEVGNAIGTIAAETIVKEAPITSLTDLINARVPGAQVVQQGGYTGSSSRIRIRGINSISLTNDPLLIVDGVRVENSVTVNGGFGFVSGRFNDLNPQEIESVEVLKGPSAATLYGTDAANGVIVVTTKRGTADAPRWTAFVENGLIDQPARFPDTYYGWGRNLATGASQQCPLAQVAAGRCVIDSVTTFNPLMNPETSVIGTGSRIQYGAQVTGGMSRILYFLSGTHEDETGYLRMPDLEAARVSAERGGAAIPEEQLRPNALKRTHLRSNLTTPFGESGDVSLALGFISADDRIPSPTIFSAANLGRGYRDSQNGWGSPLPGEAFGVRNAEAVTRYTTSLNGNWRPLDRFTTRSTIGLDFSSTFLDALQRRGEGSLGTAREGRRTNTRTDIWQYTADIGASMLATPAPELTARTSAGVQYNRRQLQAVTASGTRLPPGSVTIDGAAVVTASEQNVESVVAGAYVEEALALNERLFITGALRADGGSAFGRDFKTALYPKTSVSWLALKRPNGYLHGLRVRAAYGASGVMPAATAAIPQIALAATQVNGIATTGAVLSAIGNPDLKPERQTELETGVDAELFGGRVHAEATYYKRMSRDALINRPLPSELGVSSRLDNIGAVSNRGLEGLLTARVADNSTVQWDVSFNGSQNWNRVERLGDGISQIGFLSGLNRVGYPLFSQFARPILGFEDANGNGIIESTEVQIGDSLVYVGPTIPPRQLTIGSAVSFPRARLRISTQLDRRSGFVVTNSQLTVRCSTAASSCRAVADPTAPLVDQARAVARNLPSPTLYGFIEDGSFVRWRELSVTYDLPALPVRLAHARNASLTLTGRNLALFTGFRGADPEGAAAVQGLEGYNQAAGAPPARYWIARFNMGF